MSARETAVRVLSAVRKDGSYAALSLDTALSAGDLSAADQAFVTKLVYGVLERRLTLDYCLSACSAKPMSKCHPAVADHLRVAAYQLLYMDRIPASAAVNEAVGAVKRRWPYAAGFTNGVLRALAARKDTVLDNLPNADEGLSVRYSCPVSVIEFWRRAYGEEILQGILASLNEEAPTFLRVNTAVTTTEAFLDAADKAGVECAAVDGLPDAVEVFFDNSLKRLEKSFKNWYYHQDIASQYCVRALGAMPGEKIADVCAAPGGKSLTAAQYMQGRGEILSGDIYPQRCDEMARRAELYKALIIRTVCRDAAKEPPAAMQGRFDRVICDVPCSGLGVIRRRPEIRYRPLAEYADLPALQLSILSASAKLVRPGGVLQYSTCTWNPAENREVAEEFLKNHPDFLPRPLEGLPDSLLQEPAWCRTLFPAVCRSDGFFIAGFVKKGVEG